MALRVLPLAGFLLVSVMGWPSVSSADFLARVITVHEGDRLTIHHDRIRETIYLKAIDCPELKQPYGPQARRATAAYIGNREVVVRALTRKQGRVTAEVFLPDGRNVGHELIKEGLAWWRSAGSGDRSLGELEELARASGKGLWSEPNPVPPWKWKPAKQSKRKFSN